MNDEFSVGGSRRVEQLDFLRGLAILSVIGFHIVVRFDPGINLVRQLLSLGFQGVQLFFLISAITMCYMWDRRAGEGSAAIKFYIRRFFRIAPAFWIAICGYLLLNGLGPSKWAPEGIGAKQIVLSWTFLNGFWPDTINAIVPGGWSIVDEMMFYAFFPFLIVWLRRDPELYLVVAFLTYLLNIAIVQPIYAELLREFPYQVLRKEFDFFQFFNQAPIFLVGIALYHLAFRPPKSKRPFILMGATLALWVALAFVLRQVYSIPSSPIFWLAIGIMAVFVVLALTLGLKFAPINWLGRLSYSIYLIHFAVIEGVAALFVHLGIPQQGSSVFLSGTILVVACCWVLGMLFERTVEFASSWGARKLIDALPEPKLARAAVEA